MIKVDFRTTTAKAGCRVWPCQWLCAALTALLIPGCELGSNTVSGEIGSVEGFAGVVIADEPRAVVAARDALVAGGSAADAAVALYFTLAVTLPSAAALGGGGVCVVHDPKAERPYALDFLPRASADGSIGSPGNVRGMATLHARLGRMRWSQLLAPAEDAARGTSVSRALAADLAAHGPALLGDPEARRVFSRADGSIADEGDGLRQLDLAGTISQIRREGAGALYSGRLAVRLAQAAQDAGLAIAGDSLRAVRPEVRDALVVGLGERAAYFAPPPAAGGLLGAQLAVMLTTGRDYGAGAGADRAHLFVEASKRAVAEAARVLDGESVGSAGPVERLSPGRLQALMQDYDSAAATPISASGTFPAGSSDPGATGFVVADGDGGAVACEVTLNRPFGSGRIIPGTGIIVAAPRPGGRFPVGPVIAIHPDRGTADFVGAASGGEQGTMALVAVLLDTAMRAEPLDSSMAAKRIHYIGTADAVAYEEGVDDSIVAELLRRGHALERAPALGRVNALWCSGGLGDDSDSCEASADPRGSGLAVIQAD